MHLTKRSFDEENHALLRSGISRLIKLALVYRLLEAISHVDSFTKHQSCCGSFVRLCPQPLAHVCQDARLPRPVPKEELVVELLLERSVG